MVKRLLIVCNREQITLTELARRSGVNYHSIKSWRTRCSPLLTHLEACFNVVGRRLMDVPDDR